jgi:hypothetical protein
MPMFMNPQRKHLLWIGAKGKTEFPQKIENAQWKIRVNDGLLFVDQPGNSSGINRL